MARSPYSAAPDFLPEGIADPDITDTMLDEAISEIMEVEMMQMARRGSRRGQADSAQAQGIGTASRVTVKNITAALKLLSPAAAQRFSHFMEAARSYFGITFGRTAAINKAERDGKFDRESADAFIGKLFGLGGHNGQEAHDTPAVEALREILDVSPAAFSHRGVKPVPFAENVAKAIAGKLPANAILDFGSPSPVLLQAGVPDLPMALGNIDHLFRLAILEQTRDGKKADDPERVATIRHFIVPMPFADELLEVRIMAKEFEDPAEGNRLYLIQAAKIVTPASLTGASDTPKDVRSPHRPAGVEEIFARLVDAVKKGPTEGLILLKRRSISTSVFTSLRTTRRGSCPTLVSGA